jgi:hypothetical protein
MGLTNWVLKQQLKAQSTLQDKFRKALKDDMRKYQKKHNGQKPTVNEVVHEFEKNPFVMANMNKVGMTIHDIKRIAEEVLSD